MERSYDEVKITDIVEKTGVSVGTFYCHFPSKDGIIDEGYRCFDEELEALWITKSPKLGYETILLLISEQILTEAKKITEGILRISRGIIYDWCLHRGAYDVREIPRS